MEQQSIYPFNLVDTANKDLAKLSKELQVVRHETDGTYSVEVLTLGADKAITGISSYAEDCSIDELPEIVGDAWAHVRVTANTRVDNDILYKYVPGGTHDLPALVLAFADVNLYFHDNDTDTMECVNNCKEGIDAYQERNGSFYVLAEDYETALQQVDDHDERGIER